MTEIGIKSDSFQSILDKKKTIEGRLAKPQFLEIKVGDEMLVHEDVWRDGVFVSSQPHTLSVMVTQINRFGAFREMLENLGFEKFRPEDESIEAAIQTYRMFYSEADEQAYGVLGISFVLKSSDEMKR